MRVKSTRLLSARGAQSIFLSLVATASLSGFYPQHASSADGGLQIEVLSHTGETEVNLEYLRRGIATIPLPVQEQIRDAGLKVVLTPRFIYDEPEQSGKTVFRNGQTSDNIGGEFQTWEKASAHTGESFMGKQRTQTAGQLRSQSCSPRTRQRLGLFTRRNLKVSWHLAAYDVDFGRLGGEQKRKWAYYITGTSTGDATVPTASGHAELLASLLAALCTPIEHFQKEKELLEDFPNVAAYLISIEPSLQSLPKHVPTEQAAQKAHTEV